MNWQSKRDVGKGNFWRFSWNNNIQQTPNISCKIIQNVSAMTEIPSKLDKFGNFSRQRCCHFTNPSYLMRGQHQFRCHTNNILMKCEQITDREIDFPQKVSTGVTLLRHFCTGFKKATQFCTGFIKWIMCVAWSDNLGYAQDPFYESCARLRSLFESCAKVA